jgi:hypothetical protein
MFKNLLTAKTYTYQEIILLCKEYNLDIIPFYLQGGAGNEKSIFVSIDKFTEIMEEKEDGARGGSFQFQDKDSDKDQVGYVYFSNPSELLIYNEKILMRYFNTIKRENGLIIEDNRWKVK